MYDIYIQMTTMKQEDRMSMTLCGSACVVWVVKSFSITPALKMVLFNQTQCSQSWLLTLQTQYSQSWLFTHCGCPFHSECEVGQGEVE